MAESSHRVGRRWRIIICATAVVAVLTGCTLPAGTRAGGGALTVVLTLGTPDGGEGVPYVEDLERFAEIVAERTHGAMRIELDVPAVDFQALDNEVQLAGMLSRGEIELAFLPTRAFTELGVTRFQPLEIPFLITSDAAGAAVARDPLMADMLESVGDGLVGVGVLFESVRRPVGYPLPLAAPADFDGETLRVSSSAIAQQTLRALGAKPARVVSYLNSGDTSITGAESGFGWVDALPVQSVITANVALSAKFNAVVASQTAWERLETSQRDVLTAAVRELAAENRTTVEDEDAERFCDAGNSVVFAAPQDVAALQALTEPVASTLAQHAQASADLASIRKIVAGIPDNGLELSLTCGEPGGDSAPWPDEP